MAVEIPTIEPAELRAGDTWKWKRTDLEDYPSSTYTLKYSFKNAASHIEITATAEADDTFSITVTAATTAGYTAGTYSYVAYVEKGAGASIERYPVGSGSCKVLKAFTDTSPYDSRSHAKKTLDAIEAAIEALNLGVKSYTIASGSMNRTVTYDDIPSLLVLRSKYRTEYQSELTAARAAQGLDSGRRIGVRFRRV